jgi:RNase P subunit RPR2
VNMSGSSESLGASLGPALQEHCGGRLGPIEWFHNDWQHSGAATGFSTWTFSDQRRVDVLVKIPVGPVELDWTLRCAGTDPSGNFPEPSTDLQRLHDDLPTPHVMAAGRSIGAYELGWLVIERFPGATLSHEHDEQSIRDLLHALADFHELAHGLHPVQGSAQAHDWEKLIEKARQNVREHVVAEHHRWAEAIKKVQKHLAGLIARWNGRSICVWCHGDLHPGNAMRREARRGERAHNRRGTILIDLALIHPGHWIEDVLYLERLYWARPELLYGIKPVSALAQIRRNRGLPVEDSYADLAMVRRVLMAACGPAFLEHEGHPKFLKAALEQLERALPQVVK